MLTLDVKGIGPFPQQDGHFIGMGARTLASTPRATSPGMPGHFGPVAEAGAATSVGFRQTSTRNQWERKE
jgi:hypothetical protein